MFDKQTNSIAQVVSSFLYGGAMRMAAGQRRDIAVIFIAVRLNNYSISVTSHIRSIAQLLLCSALAYFAAGHNEMVGILFRRAGLLTFACGLAPGALCAAQTAALPTLAAAVWVVNRVHRRTADCRADAHPARAACFANHHEVMLVVGNLAERCPAGVEHFAHLA